MLHVTTEIGVPGKKERQKRHFPSLHNSASEPSYKPRARRYIPHGQGEEVPFVPHNQQITPRYTENGPDWKSKLRWIPSPDNPQYPAEELWPNQWKAIRTFPWSVGGKTGQEWNLYTEGYHSTLRSKWDGIHKKSKTSLSELTHEMLFGKNKKVIDKRNGIPLAAPGDKTYQVVEYSPEFHKQGTTLPLVKFGGNQKTQVDTFVPLHDLPPIPIENFKCKDRKNKLMEEVHDVRRLDNWRPASPLGQSM